MGRGSRGLRRRRHGQAGPATCTSSPALSACHRPGLGDHLRGGRVSQAGVKGEAETLESPASGRDPRASRWARGSGAQARLRVSPGVSAGARLGSLLSCILFLQSCSLLYTSDCLPRIFLLRRPGASPQDLVLLEFAMLGSPSRQPRWCQCLP